MIITKIEKNNLPPKEHARISFYKINPNKLPLKRIILQKIPIF